MLTYSAKMKRSKDGLGKKLTPNELAIIRDRCGPEAEENRTIGSVLKDLRRVIIHLDHIGGFKEPPPIFNLSLKKVDK